MPGRSLEGNGLSQADAEAVEAEAVEAARKAGCKLGASQPKSPVAEAVTPSSIEP